MMKNKTEIRLNRLFFARNRHREKEYDDVFSMTHKSLISLSNMFFMVMFAPAIAITNLLSNAVFISILNIFLSTGYCAKFIQRIREDEVSKLELVISLFFIALSLAITFYLAPVTLLGGVLNTIGFINHIATGINSFFLVRNILLPPFEVLIQHVFTSLGYEITTSFFNKTPLTLEHDRHVLDRLLRKFYNHDSHSEQFNEKELLPFNNILSTLSRYINKYNEPFLGNLINHDRINQLETSVSQFILHGNTDSALVFIRKKIDFKTSKVNLLRQSSKEFIKDNSEGSFKFNHRFFKLDQEAHEGEQDEIKAACLSLFEKEINRQNAKIDLLRSCLPNNH